jgi:RuvA, C-terminal domain
VGEPARVTAASSPAASRAASSRCVANQDSANEADAISALRNLDVPAKHAREAVSAALSAGAEDLESMLRQAFAFLGRTIYKPTRVGTSSRARERVRLYRPRGAKAPGCALPG